MTNPESQSREAKKAEIIAKLKFILDKSQLNYKPDKANGLTDDERELWIFGLNTRHTGAIKSLMEEALTYFNTYQTEAIFSQIIDEYRGKIKDELAKVIFYSLNNAISVIRSRNAHNN